jgi:AcrR family transcriptional regulator
MSRAGQRQSKAATPPAPAVPRHTRQTKQKQLRDRLLATGLELFQRQGFDATTVAEIADQAGMSRRSFFRYFPSKDDLVFDWLLEQGAFISQGLASRTRGEHPLLAIRAAMIELARQLDLDRAPAMLLTRLVLDTPTLNRRFSAEIASWEDGLVDIIRREGPLPAAQEFALRVQTAAAATAFLGAMRAWALGGHDGSLQAWIEAAYRALEGGFEELARRPTPARRKPRP